MKIRQADRVTHVAVFNVGTVVSVDGDRAHVQWQGRPGVWVEEVRLLSTCEKCRGSGFSSEAACGCAFGGAPHG